MNAPMAKLFARQRACSHRTGLRQDFVDLHRVITPFEGNWPTKGPALIAAVLMSEIVVVGGNARAAPFAYQRLSN